MNAIDLKRAEFRHYLEASGVMDALSFALIKLYDEVDKPSDPVAFVRQHFKRPTDELEDIPKRIEDMDASELIKKQEYELNLARQEVAKLRQMLNAMTSNSPLVGNADNEPIDEPSAYQKIFSDSKYDGTLIKKYLTEELFEKLLELPNDPKIVDCIANVNTLQANPIGVIVLNGNCYNIFNDLFEPIIKEIHSVDEFIKHPDCDWGDGNVFESLEHAEIVSIEISCSRSISNIPFIPGANEQDLETILTAVQNAIQSAQPDDDEIDGEFYKITDVKENEPIFVELQKSGLGFRSMCSENHHLWPIGRALYVNGARTQSILINEQEHLRFVSKEMNGDFGLVYRNLIELIGKFSGGLNFERSDKFGWLTTNLDLLGTGICCKSYLKLQYSDNRIRKVAEQSGIKIISIDAIRTDDETENGFNVELSNRKTFGVSEFECVKLFFEGIKQFMQTMENDELPEETTEEPNEKDSQESPVDEAEPKLNEDEETGDGTVEGTGEASGETVQDISVANGSTNNEENNADDTNEDNNENVAGVENTENTENDPNEPLTNTETVNEENDKGPNDEKPSSDENATIPSEPNNENNTDNIAEGEEENKLENNDIDPQENQNEMESTDQPNDTEKQVEKEAEEQPVEG